MKNMVQGEGLPLKQLPIKTRELVERETQNIRIAWKTSAQGIITIGQSLALLKGAMSRPLFLEHIRRELSLNEMMAHRFISVALKFADSSSVLSAKPSVLYLLAGAEDLGKVKRLADGHAIKVGNKLKTLSELTVADATKIKKNRSQQADEATPAQMDRQRAATAHEELGELAQQIMDWCNDIVRFQKKNIDIKNRELLFETLREAKAAVDSCLRVVR